MARGSPADRLRRARPDGRCAPPALGSDAAPGPRPGARQGQSPPTPHRPPPVTPVDIQTESPRHGDRPNADRPPPPTPIPTYRALQWHTYPYTDTHPLHQPHTLHTGPLPPPHTPRHTLLTHSPHIDPNPATTPRRTPLHRNKRGSSQEITPSLSVCLSGARVSVRSCTPSCWRTPGR